MGRGCDARTQIKIISKSLQGTKICGDGRKGNIVVYGEIGERNEERRSNDNLC